MKEVIIHRYCGILSAYGMGLADVVEEAQEPYAAVYGSDSMFEVSKRSKVLTEQVRQQLRLQGFKDENIHTNLYLNLRYEGTDTAMMIRTPQDGSNNYAGEFLKQFRQEYGFELQKRNILISDVRVHGVGVTNILKPVVMEKTVGEPKAEESYQVYFSNGWQETPVYLLENLGYGHTIKGPAIIMNGNNTLLIESVYKAAITKHRNIRIEIGSVTINTELVIKVVDVVHLSTFKKRFMGIAKQMGAMLQRNQHQRAS
jgi:5-oxoprolinase (ATP-hydrolysing)